MEGPVGLFCIDITEVGPKFLASEIASKTDQHANNHQCFNGRVFFMHLSNNPLKKMVLPPAGEHRHECLKTADASESDSHKTSESEPAAKPKPVYVFMCILYKIHPEVNVDLTLIPIIYNVLA